MEPLCTVLPGVVLGALTSSAVNRLPEEALLSEKNNKFFNEWWLINYPVPLKENETLTTKAINWTLGFHDKRTVKFQFSKESEEPTKKDWEIMPDVCEKWVNTVKFHETVCNNCR